MTKIITSFLFALVTTVTFAQTTISGKVVDNKGIPISGANIYLDGTYDGSSSDIDGNFKFTTSEKGSQVLIISFISFENYVLTADVETMQELKIQLKEDVNTLDSVVLNAGSFSAGDNSKVAALKPLDIVTTAGALGDVAGAFQTLPGTTTVAEDGRLFVRGGDANETNVYIDNLRVFQPFNATANNLPTRGRFSSFLFDGVNFSTGGYSAQYGDALSGVLLLNTVDEPDQKKTELQFLTVGLGGGNTQKWKNNSLSLNGFYVNLKPYQEIINQNIEWIKPYESLSGEAVFRQKIGSGLLKVYGALSYANFELIQPDINLTDGLRFGLKNTNLYSNVSYENALDNDWFINTGISFANDKNDINIESTAVDNSDNSAQLRMHFRKRFSNRFKLNFGVDQFLGSFEETANSTDFDTFKTNYQNNSTAAFAEANIFFSKKLAMQNGVRATHNYLLGQTTVAPRVSLAYKMASKSQVSFAFGDFYQSPMQEVLKYDTNLTAQKSSQYILNYLYQNNGRMFRAEGYYKSYNDLITYDTIQPQFDSAFNNQGNGYATGLDLFWRDNKSIKNMDYWVSYSYLDTERKYQNYPTAVTPNFAAAHNLSVVTKYWINAWKSQLGVTYNFASGRPYNNPNNPAFMDEKTKSYNTLDIGWAYLMSPQKILYFSVSNALGFDNVFNYQYANNPNTNGNFDRRAIGPTADRFFVIGFFWTISDNKNDNQLNDL